MTTPCFGYCRVSGRAQIEGDGLTRQREAIQKYADANNLHVVKFYDELGVSGTLIDRPALMLMMRAMDEGVVKTVIIERMDRLARDLLTSEFLVAEFAKNNIGLISVAEGPNLLESDPSRKFLRQVLGAVAEFNKSLLIARMEAGKRRVRAVKGKCEGRKGYAADWPELREKIMNIRSSLHLGWGGIAKTLNSRGQKTIDGKRFTRETVKRIVKSTRVRAELVRQSMVEQG